MGTICKSFDGENTLSGSHESDVLNTLTLSLGVSQRRPLLVTLIMPEPVKSRILLNLPPRLEPSALVLASRFRWAD